MVAGTFFGLIVYSLVITQAASDSCSGRCGQSVNSAYNCQCNAACSRYNDCCGDYRAVCLGETCSGRCGHAYDSTQACQCNTACASYGNCCGDYNSLCLNAGTPGTTPGSLSDIMTAIWNSDVNRLSDYDITINVGGTRLFTYVVESKLQSPTYSAFIHLLDNYDRAIGQAEYQTTEEMLETEAFVDLIMATDAMSLAYTYLEMNGKVSTPGSFREMFMELWFNFYSRSSSSSTPDSSGFEHVLVGETKSSTVSGFHSWIQFYLEEKKGNLVYSRMVATGEPSMKGAAFNWHGKYKSMGSFFLGTSPEFDMAVYTICAVMHTNSRCNFSLLGHSVSIQTYDISHKAGNQLGTAYPAI